MKTKHLLTIMAAFAAIIMAAASARAGKVSTPTLTAVGATEGSITVTFCAGSTGAKAGFSLQYMSCADYSAYTNAHGVDSWPDSSTICAVSLSGNANGSAWSLTDGQCKSFTVGYLNDADPGVSFSCNDPLPCGTCWVFRGFAHNVPNSDLKKSDVTPVVWAHTVACPPPPPPSCKTNVPCTYTKGAYGNSGSGGYAALAAGFATAFPSGLVVGTGYTMTFTSATAVEAYLPGTGDGDPVLTASYVNPTTITVPQGKNQIKQVTPGGNLGAQVVTLKINVALNNLVGNCYSSFTACNYSESDALGGSLLTSAQVTAINGQTIAQVLAAAETALGGGTPAYGLTAGQLTELVANLNEAYDECAKQPFEKDHICGDEYIP
jgi:hypothetical protein